MRPVSFEDREIPINWQWYVRVALIDLMGWLIIFALMFLIANYMVDGTFPFLEQ